MVLTKNTKLRRHTLYTISFACLRHDRVYIREYAFAKKAFTNISNVTFSRLPFPPQFIDGCPPQALGDSSHSTNFGAAALLSDNVAVVTQRRNAVFKNLESPFCDENCSITLSR